MIIILVSSAFLVVGSFLAITVLVLKEVKAEILHERHMDRELMRSIVNKKPRLSVVK